MKSFIDIDSIELPLKIEFEDSDPIKYKMADLLILDTQYAVSNKLKNILEREKVYGVQFLQVEIETEKGEIIKGHYAMHVCNRLAVIDKKSYIGGKPDKLGMIMDLERFSLDETLLDKKPFEERKLIRIAEDPSMLIVHQSIHDAIKAEGLIGMCMFRIDQWDTGSNFRE